MLHIILVLVLALASCTGLKFVPAGEKLFTGSSVSIEQNKSARYSRKAKKEAKDLLQPQPNSKLLWMRPSVWIFYKTQSKEKGMGHWMNRKLGQKPVYASSADPEVLSQAMDARLFNLGYFDAHTTYKWNNDSQTASVQMNKVSRARSVIGTLCALWEKGFPRSGFAARRTPPPRTESLAETCLPAVGPSCWANHDPDGLPRSPIFFAWIDFPRRPDRIRR